MAGRKRKFVVRNLKLEIDENIEHTEIEFIDDEVTVRASSQKIGDVVQSALIEEKFRGMVEMASFLTHEIKNPLFALKAKVLSGAEKMEKRDIGLIKLLFERIESIISNVTIFTRGQTLAAKNKINIEAIIEDVIREFLEIKDTFHYDFEIERSYSSDRIFVLGDDFLIRRCFYNVLINAIESLENSLEKKVRIRTYDYGDFVVCEFRDSGCGIPPSEIHKIFIPFYTTKVRGTGLGMSVVRKVVELHGGKVEVESQLNVGTTVRLFFPYSESDSI